jgi:hypothetical protein
MAKRQTTAEAGVQATEAAAADPLANDSPFNVPEITTRPNAPFGRAAYQRHQEQDASSDMVAPGLILGETKPGWRYTSFAVADWPPAQRSTHRERLRKMGFIPVNGPWALEGAWQDHGRPTVRGVDLAEIWACDPETAEDHHERRMAYKASKPNVREIERNMGISSKTARRRTLDLEAENARLRKRLEERPRG